MRWHITENKRRIAAETFEGHSDKLEMSGERVSGVIGYGVREGVPFYTRQFSFPMFRVQPNNTHGSYQPACNIEPIQSDGKEQFERVELDGVLSVYSHVGQLKIVRRFFPSVERPIFYEQVELFNGGEETVSLKWETVKRFDGRFACEGYVYAECIASEPARPLAAGERRTVLFGYGARFANEQLSLEEDPLAARRRRVLELMTECDITTGNDVVDTMFAFAKVRAGESLFRTGRGLVHCPGGLTYYAAIWCNYECEYAAPWFAFTGDEKEAEAIRNIYGWYAPYFNDEYKPIPSSLIAEGRDHFGCAGDRGDVEMYFYGLTRVLLTLGRLPNEEEKRILTWCREFIRRNTTLDGVIFSDSDELENRISSGINLSTSSLAYGALGNYAVLLERMGEGDEAEKTLRMQARLQEAIERYFGGEVSGYQTYHYHKGCNVIRAWNCLPVYMGIEARAKETLQSIDENLWTGGSCRTTEGEKTLWDRSALYFLMALFRAGETEKGWERLKEYAETRLLGEHVPFAVEAYPEGGMRHLSGESALFCRVMTDGLLDLRFTKEGYFLNAHLPEEIDLIDIKNLYINGKTEELHVKR